LIGKTGFTKITVTFTFVHLARQDSDPPSQYTSQPVIACQDRF